jgi:spore maturation protein CgeB
MKVLLIWPSHTNSTWNTAFAYHKALKRLNVKVADFIYSTELITQNLAINAFRGTKDVTYDGDAIYKSNLLLMGYVATALPDVVMIATGLDLYKSAWKWLNEFRQQLKNPYKIVTIFTETPYRPSEEIELAMWSDYIFTNEANFVDRFRQFQPRTWYMPQAYDDRLHKPGEREHIYDVYMCGSGFKKRLEILSQVDWDETGADLTLKGLFPDIDKDSVLYPYYQEGLVKNEKVVEDYQASNICLNIHRQEGEIVIFERDLPNSYSREKRNFKVTDAYSMNNRTCEIAATGGFQIVDDSRQEIKDVFGDSVPRFAINEPGELQELVRFYTQQPSQRAKLAEEARLRIQGRTYLANTKKILNLITGG